MEFLRRNKIILLILALTLVLRLIAVNQSFWLDESIGALAVRDFTYSEIITKLLVVDNHSPLYYLMLKFWSDMWGYSEFALRSLTILFSLVSIYFTYKIAQLLTTSKLVWYFSALFLSVSQFYVYYSQEARMYMPAAAFATMAVLYFLRLLKESKIHNWILFSFSITALIFTDYVPVFILPAFFVTALVYKTDKKWWVTFIASFIPLILLGVAWLPIFTQQLHNSPYTLRVSPNWRNVAGGANFKQAALLVIKFTSGRISFVNKKLYYFYAFIAAVPFVIAQIKNASYKKLFPLYMFLLIPTVGLFVASVFFPGFIYFRLTYVYPFFALVVSYVLFHAQRSYLLASLILAVNIFSLGVYYTDTHQQREQWNQAVSYIETEAEPGSLTLFRYPQPFSPYRWYNKGRINAEGAFLTVNASTEGTKEHIESLIADKATLYTFDYLKEISDTDNLLDSVLIENDFEIVNENANFVGIGKITTWQR